MARRADPTPGHQRFLGLAAVAGLSVATALAFGRVFTGRQATLELVAAALASVAIAALFERRGLLLATLASLVGLALAITWIVLPQTAWYGLPSIRTLRAIGRSLEFVGQQARVRVAPTPPLPPLMLAAVTAVWTAAFSSHALAIRAGSPLLAILPPIALVGFADTVLEDGARPIYAIILLAAALAVVFADGLRRVRQWGPVWSGSRTRRLGASVRGSRPVAFAVIAAAVLVPGLLPGFRSGPLVDFSTSGDEGAGLDPFISIHAQLTDDEPVRDLFEVQTPDPQYLRMYTLDEFDGEGWRSSDPNGSDGQTLTVPTVLPQPSSYAPPPDSQTAAVHLHGPHGLRRVARAPDGADARADHRGRPGRRHLGSGPRPGVRGRRARRRARIHGPLPRGRPHGRTARTGPQPHLPAVRAMDPPPRRGRPRSTDRGDREGVDGRRRLGLREGARDPAALPQRRVPVQHGRRRGRRPGRLAHVPHADQGRLLPAVRHGDGGAGPRARAARAGRRRLPGRHAPGRRHVPGPERRRARVGRGLLRGLRLAPVRAHPGARHPPERGPGHLPEPGQELDEPRRDEHQPRRPEQRRRRGRSRMRRGGRPLSPGAPAPVPGREPAPAGPGRLRPACHRSGPPRPTGRGIRCRTG